MKFCHYCGYVCDDQDKFCVNCGAPFTAAETAEAPAPAEPEQAAPSGGFYGEADEPQQYQQPEQQYQPPQQQYQQPEQQYQPPQQQYQQPQQQYQQPAYTEVLSGPTTEGLLTMIFGIVGFAMSFFAWAAVYIGIVGLGLCIAARVIGKKRLKQGSEPRAKVGYILALIGIILNAIMIFVSIIMLAAG